MDQYRLCTTTKVLIPLRCDPSYHNEALLGEILYVLKDPKTPFMNTYTITRTIDPFCTISGQFKGVNKSKSISELSSVYPKPPGPAHHLQLSFINMDQQHIPAIIFDLIRTSKWPSNHPVLPSQTLRIFQHTHPKYHELVLFSTNTLYGVNHLTNYIHLSLINYYLYISPSTDPPSGQI